MFCFEKKGVLLNPEDDDSVIAEINQASFEKYVAEGIINGGMIPKLENSFDAIRAGVKAVVISKADELGKGSGTTVR